MSFSEFKLIERYFAQRARASQNPDRNVLLGIGDDAALLNVPVGMELAVSVDTLISGVHFPVNTHPADIGHKSLAVNLSDMAAMGAQPCWATLALTLPEADETWLAGFSEGFFTLAERYGVQLIGGDTTRGPLSITVQIHGLVPPGQALRRSAAQSGDLIYVTGELGDAGLALRMLQGKTNVSPEYAAYSLARLNRPEPRINAGLSLRGIAHAAIDISDGLAADIGHILAVSNVGATLHVERLPLSAGVASVVMETGDWNLPLASGDDYELCFTVPVKNESRLRDVLEHFSCRCTYIGTIESTPSLRYELANGKLFTPEMTGYEHFASGSD
jgi:thiamine-monophosphate kinase